MRTREKGYTDHGFENEKEAEKVIEYCRSPDFQYGEELLRSAITANKTISYDIFYSIVNDLSYNDISRIKYIPISIVDFYGYRRKCLGNMRDWLRLHGICF